MARKFHVELDVEVLSDEVEEFLSCVDHHIEYLLNLDEWALNVSNAHATEIVSDAGCAYEIYRATSNGGETIEKFDAKSDKDATIYFNDCCLKANEADGNCRYMLYKVGKHDPSSFQLIGQHWVGRKEV